MVFLLFAFQETTKQARKTTGGGSLLFMRIRTPEHDMVIGFYRVVNIVTSNRMAGLFIKIIIN